MRHRILAGFIAPSFILALAAVPAEAQVHVGVHIDIPIFGHPPVIVHRPAPAPPRVVVVYDYSAHDFGRWNKEARKWHPVTLYYYQGRYYERPFGNARAVRVFSYHDRYFFQPRERDWYDYRDRTYGRDNRFDDRFDGRDDDRWDGRGDDRYDRGRDERDVRDDNRNERARPTPPQAPPARGGRGRPQ